MLVEDKKIFLRKALIMLDDKIVERVVQSKKYSALDILSYNILPLLDFKVRVKTTAIIDIQKTEEEIFKKFNDTTRNEIRKTEKIDSLVFKCEDQNFKQIYRVYKNFEMNQGRFPVAKYKLSQCKIFSAYYKNEPISAFFVFCSPPFIRIRSIFSKRLDVQKDKDKEFYKIISNSSRRLMWELCRWGKRKGFQSVDLASVNFNNPKTASITKFKMSFGGEIVDEYTYIYKSKYYAFFEKIIFFKFIIFYTVKKIKNIFNKFN